MREVQTLKSFASVDSNAALPCSVLIESSRTGRFSRGSIVVSTDWMVLHRGVELAALTGQMDSAEVCKSRAIEILGLTERVKSR